MNFEDVNRRRRYCKKTEGWVSELCTKHPITHPTSGVVRVTEEAMEEATQGVQEVPVGEALLEFRATLQAAVKEVHVDVSAFKQRIERRIEEQCFSNGPLAEAVSRLQEENLQLRSELEALSRIVERLAGSRGDGSPADAKAGKTEDGVGNGKPAGEQRGPVRSGGSESQSMSTHSSSQAAAAAAAAPSSTPAPPPWRAKRQAEMNVSTFS